MLAATSTQGASGATAALAPQPRLIKAAHEFEAQMMKEFMKPMTRSVTGTGDDADSDSDQDSGSNGALGEFASEALAQALSQQGGFGIAKGIVHSLSQTGNHPGHPR